MSVNLRKFGAPAATLFLMAVRWIGRFLRKRGWATYELGFEVEKWAETRLSDKGGQGE